MPDNRANMIGDCDLAARGRGNDRTCAPVSEQLPEAVGVVALVAEQAPNWPPGVGEQHRSHGDVVDVAGREQQYARPSSGVRQGMQLRRPAAARASDRLGVSPPFPPPAERCALMCVLSMEAVPMTPELPLNVRKISNQSPCLLQRLKRL